MPAGAAGPSHLISEFEQRKVNSASLTERIETGSPAGRLVFHVCRACRIERNLIRERTIGRPSQWSQRERWLLLLGCKKDIVNLAVDMVIIIRRD